MNLTTGTNQKNIIPRQKTEMFLAISMNFIQKSDFVEFLTLGVGFFDFGLGWNL
jgi:hypothetical protein